jgi:hypothetical protein
MDTIIAEIDPEYLTGDKSFSVQFSRIISEEGVVCSLYYMRREMPEPEAFPQQYVQPGEGN